jgi:hypothetical protein
MLLRSVIGIHLTPKGLTSTYTTKLYLLKEDEEYNERKKMVGAEDEG